MMVNEDLYGGICAISLPFSFDPVDERFFRRKLMENNHGWDEIFAAKAIHEYKRFMYLAQISEAVTPSYVVDQVWHQHMLYTRSYKRFSEVIGKFIHHEPNSGKSQQETNYHKSNFVETTKLYRAEFNMDAPFEMWWINHPHKMVDVHLNYVIDKEDSKSLFKAFIKSLKSKFTWFGY